MRSEFSQFRLKENSTRLPEEFLKSARVFGVHIDTRYLRRRRSSLQPLPQCPNVFLLPTGENFDSTVGQIQGPTL
jgi:hypothetical protein